MADHSPATRAALVAFVARFDLCGPFDDDWPELCLAAAFRALADHYPAALTLGQPINNWTPSIWTRRELRIMAGELEGDGSTGS